MFYWVIPYLVAYNLTEPAEYWKHGPVHIFEAELHAKVVRETEANYHSDVTMLFECRPINASSIKCQVQNASLENYQMMDNNETRVGREKVDWFTEFGGINFVIVFDALGIKNLTFPESRGYHHEMVIRFIFDSLNVGIDLTDKSFDRYDAIDKSLYGDCPTNFKITKLAKRVANKELSLKRDVAVRKLMIIPFLNEFSDDATILIEKERKMTECLNKKIYIFGNDEPTAFDRENGLVPESDMIHAKTEIYLGKNRFGSFSEYSGIFKARIASENSKNPGTVIISGKTSEQIRLTLISILPDKVQYSPQLTTED